MRLLDELLFPLTLFAALGCGLMAGLFFAFSNFVMKALAKLNPESGIAAMRSINVAILNPVFLALFLGTAGACAVLTAGGLLRWQSPGAAWLLAGAALYLLGSFGVTIAFNVPRNDALARVEGSSDEAPRAWRDYVAGWTRWNHVRTIAALAACAALILALSRMAPCRWPSLTETYEKSVGACRSAGTSFDVRVEAAFRPGRAVRNPLRTEKEARRCDS